MKLLTATSTESRAAQCLCCGSESILTGVNIPDRINGDDRHYSLTLETYEHPEAWFFKGVRRAKVTAHVCEDCGYVMLFAKPDDVKGLQDGQSQ